MSTLSPFFDLSFYDLVSQDAAYDVSASPPVTLALPMDPKPCLEAPLFDFPSRHARSSSHCSLYSTESAGSSYAIAASVEGSRAVTPFDNHSPETKHRQPVRYESPAVHQQHGPLLLPKIRSQDQDQPLDLGANLNLGLGLDIDLGFDMGAVRGMSGRSAKRASSLPYSGVQKRKYVRKSSAPPRALSSSQLSCINNVLDSVAGPTTIDLTLDPAEISVLATAAPTTSSANAPAQVSAGMSVLTTEDHLNFDLGIDPLNIQSRSLAYSALPDYQFPSAQAYSLGTGTSANISPKPSSHSRSASYSVSAAPTPTTTLLSYLTAPNPAASLVRTLAFPLRDPHTKHFWWDARQIRPWTDFSAAAIRSFPGAETLLDYPVAQSLLPTPSPTTRHPESESSLHAIYASTYLPKLNAALALSSPRPLKFSVPARPIANISPNELLYTANDASASASAALLFGGKPTARVVGLVRAYDRFNTAQRIDGNIKRVEYLRSLAALQHAMREHGTRYGFIITEIELVVVRNGPEATPNFGFLEIASVPLNASSTNSSMQQQAQSDGASAGVSVEAASATAAAAGASPKPDNLSACLALWVLCMMAGDEPMPGHAHWKSEIGAPAEGTRRKALARDAWMPPPQLAEKREAKRARGWVLPEDPVGRKELGKRGVKYGGC
ncbi:uncharacterized protein BROUX77_001413 [Berkeleyomyces rouxiae]|uniref:uncharacterized protein n=1 Tax=Berkeleyomyces rouxiae TaxID=2035830 RepID=UPI003B828CF4